MIFELDFWINSWCPRQVSYIVRCVYLSSFWICKQTFCSLFGFNDMDNLVRVVVKKSSLFCMFPPLCVKVYSLYSKLAGIIAAQFLHSRDGSISAAYSTAIYVFRNGYFLMTRSVTWATTSRMSTRPSAGLLNNFKKWTPFFMIICFSSRFSCSASTRASSTVSSGLRRSWRCAAAADR